MGWSLADLSAFMEKQQLMMKEERESMEAKVERIEVKLEQQRNGRRCITRADQAYQTLRL